MAEVIWQKLTSLICKSNLVDIFYHIRQVAAPARKLVLGVHLEPRLGEKEVVGGQRGSSDGGVIASRLWSLCYFYPLSHNLPSNVSDAVVNSGVGHFGLKSGRKGVDQCKPNFNTIWERGCRTQKKSCRFLQPFEHNARTWQAGRPRNGNIDRNRRNGYYYVSERIFT